MKVQKKIYKCAVCGTENEYLDYMSNFVKGYSDFDMKQVGSMIGIGANIMECPNCHYSSYQINTTIESRFTNNLKLWNELSEFQEIIKKYSGALRKILLVAKQYENNMDYSNAYKSYIMASWVCNEKNASDFRTKACQIFAEKVLPYYNSNLLQIVDILRMEGDFDDALKVIGSIEQITDEFDDKLLKIINAEKNFIQNKDISRHNLGEIFG